MSKRKTRKTQSKKATGQTGSSGSRTSTRSLPDDFNPDYSYVKNDLRSIGILAGIFITILVILSFIL